MSVQTASATDLYPDAELIGLCHECDALYLRFQDTFWDELTLKPDVALLEKRKVITTLQTNVLDQICAIHATTLKGLRARNRVNLIDTLLSLYWTERMAKALRQDTIGLLAVVKDTAAQPEPSISIPILPKEGHRMLQDHESAYNVSDSGPPAGSRRLSRVEISNSHLLALLRDSSMAGDVHKRGKFNDSLGLARTIVVKLVFSVPSWAALVVLAYILFRTLGLPARS